MDDLEPSLIPGSDLGGNILNPVLSPDGREVAFWYGPDGTIRRLAVAGGAAFFVVQAALRPYSGCAGTRKGLVFGQTGGKEIARVSPLAERRRVIARWATARSHRRHSCCRMGGAFSFQVKKDD